MKDYKKAIEDYKTISRYIYSCKTLKHVKTCLNIINNYGRMYPDCGEIECALLAELKLYAEVISGERRLDL
jgi:predicted metal-dependent HD superfamily phosphohydrolase